MTPVVTACSMLRAGGAARCSAAAKSAAVKRGRRAAGGGGAASRRAGVCSARGASRRTSSIRRRARRGGSYYGCLVATWQVGRRSYISYLASRERSGILREEKSGEKGGVRSWPSDQSFNVTVRRQTCNFIHPLSPNTRLKNKRQKKIGTQNRTDVPDRSHRTHGPWLTCSLCVAVAGGRGAQLAWPVHLQCAARR